MLAGWISSGSYGWSLTRPDSIWALMSRSERSTLATYRFRYDVWANTAQLPPGRERYRPCSCARVEFNGRTSASQADNAGSIPVTRSNRETPGQSRLPPSDRGQAQAAE